MLIQSPLPGDLFTVYCSVVHYEALLFTFKPQRSHDTHLYST